MIVRDLALWIVSIMTRGCLILENLSVGNIVLLHVYLYSVNTKWSHWLVPFPQIFILHKSASASALVLCFCNMWIDYLSVLTFINAASRIVCHLNFTWLQPPNAVPVHSAKLTLETVEGRPVSSSVTIAKGCLWPVQPVVQLLPFIIAAHFQPPVFIDKFNIVCINISFCFLFFFSLKEQESGELLTIQRVWWCR